MIDENIITRQEESAIEPSSADPTLALDRLCEYDEEGQSGCRRTQTMLAMEDIYGIHIHPEMRWGYWDLYCAHEELIYYDRQHLEWNIDEDSNESNDSVSAELQHVIDFAGSDWMEIDRDNLNTLVHSGNKALPRFIDVSERFYRFENPGAQLLTTENIDARRLEMCRIAFTQDDVNPLLGSLEGSVYIRSGKAICTNLLAFSHNPNAKLGIILQKPDDETKYYFYPFNKLTEDQEQFINKLAAADMCDVEIVYL